MKPEMMIKRNELKALSAGLQLLAKQGAIDSVNEGLAEHYAGLGHTILKSYSKWKEAGFQVKKGSSALLLWGQPRSYQKQEQPPAPDGKEDTFFPVAYVFSNLQVEASAHLAK